MFTDDHKHRNGGFATYKRVRGGKVPTYGLKKYSPTSVPGVVPRLEGADLKSVRSAAIGLSRSIVTSVVGAFGVKLPGAFPRDDAVAVVLHQVLRLMTENERLRRALTGARTEAVLQSSAQLNRPKDNPVSAPQNVADLKAFVASVNIDVPYLALRKQMAEIQVGMVEASQIRQANLAALYTELDAARASFVDQVAALEKTLIDPVTARVEEAEKPYVVAAKKMEEGTLGLIKAAGLTVDNFVMNEDGDTVLCCGLTGLPMMAGDDILAGPNSQVLAAAVFPSDKE